MSTNITHTLKKKKKIIRIEKPVQFLFKKPYCCSKFNAVTSSTLYIPVDELFERRKQKVVNGTKILVCSIQMKLQKHQFLLLHITRALNNQSILL